ncbi:MAG: HDOD domain-containing protein [Nitrospiraceae bacterium]
MSPTTKVDLKKRIEQVGELPTLPHVVQKLASMIGRPNVSAEEIGILIEKDQVLSAKVLRLANSPSTVFPPASPPWPMPSSCSA